MIGFTHVVKYTTRQLKYVAFMVCIIIVPTTILRNAHAKWMAGTQMPIARLLKNVGDYVKAHPTDADGYYTLARIQSAAFAFKAESISVYDDKNLPRFGPSSPRINTVRSDAKLSPADVAMYQHALQNYLDSVRRNPKDALHWFGQAFQLEEGLRYKETVPVAAVALKIKQPNNPSAREAIRQTALYAYRMAYKLGLPADQSGAGHLTYFLLSEEAYTSIMRLQQGRRLSASEATELDTMKATVADIKGQQRVVTPIVISTEQITTPDALIENQSDKARVSFDMLGNGKPLKWSWVKPTAGILVWDPHNTGTVKSGQQLFGTCTWWIFWKNGYEPLQSLDNNHDGALTGAELNGISVWFDRNGNGKCDAGEMVSVKRLGIRRISVQSNSRNKGLLWNGNGVEFADGHHGVTCDWEPATQVQNLASPHLNGR